MYNGFIVRDNFKNSKIYDGNTLKFGITVDGEDFIVKSGKNSITSIYSEYVASRFIKQDNQVKVQIYRQKHIHIQMFSD